MGADNISLQTVDTPVHNELRYLQLSYSYPLGIDGCRINIHGDITETNPGFSIDYLDLVGRSKNINLEIEYPLLRTRTDNFWLYGEFDWVNSYTHYADETIFQDHIRSLRFGIYYDFIDDWRGANLIELEMSKGLFHTPSDPQPPLSRTYGRTDYTKTNMKISRYQSIGERFVLLIAASGQYSHNNPLLSAEEFSFGGQQFGRAYDSSEITGDSGVAGKLELRFNTYPSFRLLQQIQYYAFYDIGAIWNVGGDDFMQHAKDSGSNIGFGLRTTFNELIYGSIEFAKPLTRKIDTQITEGRSGKAIRLYFSLGMRF